MISVIRTDGTTEKFDKQRIVKALLKETKLCEELFSVPGATEFQAQQIAVLVENAVNSLMTRTVTGRTIREIMCSILLEQKCEPFESWYTVCTRVGMPVYDAWMIDQGEGYESHDNANLKPNAETSHKKKADKLSKEQNLLTLPPHLAALHQMGEFHIHDLEYFGTRPFCADSDMRYLFYYGLIPSGDPSTSAVARPAKNAEVAILHAVKWMGSAQTNFAGGQGFYNFLTFLAPYLSIKTYPEIKQLMQMFVYEMVQMFVARGGQTVFSSVQLSPGVPKIWRDKPPVFAGSVWRGSAYGLFEREVRLAFKALMEVMLEGDAHGKPFSFPKPEIALEPCFVEPDAWVKKFDECHPYLPTYEELYSLSFELAAKFGTPYFDNMLPAYRGAGNGISCYQCCAYQFSSTIADDPEFEEKLFFVDGKHFSMGSWMVITLNFPRAAYNAKILHMPPEVYAEEQFIASLKVLIDEAVEVFLVKKKVMERLIKNNRIPFACQTPVDKNRSRKSGDVGEIVRAPPAIDLKDYVYTIGVVGLDDAVKVITGYRMNENKESLAYGLQTIFVLKKYVQELSEKHGIKIAFARTPAETTAQRFAVCDLKDPWYSKFATAVAHGDIEYAMKHLDEADLPVYYVNGTHVPPDAPVNLSERLNIEGKFFPILDGGNIAHIWLGEAWSNPEGLMDFAMNIAKTTQIGYFAFTKDFTVCNNCSQVSSGLDKTCVYCGSGDVDYISRITGYLSNVSAWNEGKKQELKDRMRVTIP